MTSTSLYDPKRTNIVFVLLSCVCFFLFFRPRFALFGVGFDESCYLEYLHRLIRMDYPSCYSPSHFPGIALVWFPVAMVAKFFAWLTGWAFKHWLESLVGLSSFLGWMLSFFIFNRILVESERHGYSFFKQSWVWIILFFLSIPVLPNVFVTTFLPHSGELIIALLALLFLYRRNYFLSLSFTLWVIAIRPTDVPMLLMFLGKYYDDYMEQNIKLVSSRKKYIICGTLLSALIIWIALYFYRIVFVTGYHGVLISSMFRSTGWKSWYETLVTYEHGLLWYTPFWVFSLLIGTLYARRLSWMARGGIIWMWALFEFVSAHFSYRVYQYPHPVEIRYLVGSIVAVLVIWLEISNRVSKRFILFFKCLLVFEGIRTLLAGWTGFRRDILFSLLSLDTWRGRYYSIDGTSMNYPLRTLVIEPVVGGPAGFTAFSWFSNTAGLARFKQFSQYALVGPRLWIFSLFLIVMICLTIFSARKLSRQKG